MTPLVLVIGFLGSGKTTFLKELAPLLERAGLKPGFVINDYQNARVDTEQLKALGLDADAISGDCVCCGSRDELIQVLQAFEHGEGRVAVVEANGTSDSEHLIEMLALEPDLAEFSSPLQVSVIDAKRWQKRFWHNALEREQARTATHVRITRSTEVTVERLAEVERSLQKLGISSPKVTPEDFVETVASVAEEVSGLPRRVISGREFGKEHSHEHGPSADLLNHSHSDTESEHDHSHASRHHFASVELPLPEAVDLKKFSRMLRDLPGEVLRAKGLVRFHDKPEEYFVFQKVEGFEEPQFFPVGPAPRIQRPLALFIGPKIDTADLAARIERCHAGTFSGDGKQARSKNPALAGSEPTGHV